jgi:phage baseplate assembly protein W
MTDIPHFTLPLRFERGAAVVAEQDETDDIASCVVAILLCPIGMRAELPEFGITDPTFSMAAVDVDVISAAVHRWEPRAEALFSRDSDALDELIEYVRGAVSAPSVD